MDGVILSHLDNDHAGDWQGLAERWQPNWIRASQLGTEFMPCIRGESWQWRSLHLRCYGHHKRLAERTTSIRV